MWVLGVVSLYRSASDEQPEFLRAPWAVENLHCDLLDLVLGVNFGVCSDNTVDNSGLISWAHQKSGAIEFLTGYPFLARCNCSSQCVCLSMDSV